MANVYIGSKKKHLIITNILKTACRNLWWPAIENNLLTSQFYF